ncbi:MAG TPA: NAD-dependent epimerase/dehydratase family protein [Actinomycetota bacterium]
MGRLEREEASVRLLVIGGARFSGRALTGLALERGHEVTMFHRGTGPDDPWPDAEHVHGDRGAGFDALAGRSFDAIVDTCAYVPRDLLTAAAAFPDTDRYVFISSVSAHRDDARPGATEDDDLHQPPFPETEDVTDQTYGPLKVACERAVRSSFGDRAVVIRPGYIVGPYDMTDRFTYWLRRATRGGEMLAPGAPDDTWQFVDARDLAAFVLLRSEQGGGGTFDVVTPAGRDTIGSLLATARDQAGADTTFTWIDEGFAATHGLLDDETIPLPIWSPREPGFHLFDTTRARDAGLTVRSAEDTIRDTLAWDYERGAPWPLRAGLDDARERALLRAWHDRD